MAGIYIHIPFCRKACHYCNFHFSTSLALKNGFLQALLNEIRLRQSYTGKEEIETIYFGGGTPSLLEWTALHSVLAAIRSNFVLAADAEITLEANPDDITREKLEAWRLGGINRLSLGIQSFIEADLRWMNRAHSASQSMESLAMARSYFSNITLDLIYGTPTLSDADWQQNVETALASGVQHLSCYALTVEPKTVLHKLIRENKLPDVNSNDQARQFLLLMDWLSARGWEHYEISNFSLPGNRSRHNSAYWQGKPYLGLGPSAHSFNGYSRQWNIANNALYIQSLERNELPFEIEVLTKQEQLNEYIMTSLRTLEGLDLGRVALHFGESAVKALEIKSRRYRDQGLLTLQHNRYLLSREGKLFADGIASDLFADA